MRTLAPVAVATALWGLVTGVAMVKAGLGIGAALGMTLIVYAGTAQLTSLPLVMAGVPLWLLFTAAFVVNLRFVIFAAGLHPYFRPYRWYQRLFLGYIGGDMNFVLFMPRYGSAAVKGTPEQTGFYVGIAAANWAVWQVASIAGILLGGLFPASWSLEFAGVLALVAIVVPMAASRPMLAALAAAGVTAWAAQPLPLRLGLVAAVVAGVAAGLLAEGRAARRGAPS
ncbi:AzlC family ABC transporter permease [Pigmentiphaga soli]|uniref:AzlC family ABC transporter permease n=1 Tax=Pigmentiphaga soli TaxID=1007095 RepID=UPI003CD0B762